MNNRFIANVEGIQFEFATMNIRKLQLFQVYVLHEGKRLRFHMQIDSHGKFKITDREYCPTIFHPLEEALSQTILKETEETAS